MNAEALNMARLAKMASSMAAAIAACLMLTSCGIVDSIDDTNGDGSALVTNEGAYAGLGIDASSDAIKDTGADEVESDAGFVPPPKADRHAQYPFRVIGHSLVFPSGESVNRIDEVLTNRWATFMLKDDKTVAYVISGAPQEAGDGYLRLYDVKNVLKRYEPNVVCAKIPQLKRKKVLACQFDANRNTTIATGNPVTTLTVVEGRRDLLK